MGNPAKPWIALSGDDDGVHYVMHPMSDELDNWDYDLKVGFKPFLFIDLTFPSLVCRS